MSRRRFIKSITGMLVATAIPKVPEVTPEPETQPKYIAGKIKTGGLIANISGQERMRIKSDGTFYVNYDKL